MTMVMHAHHRMHGVLLLASLLFLLMCPQAWALEVPDLNKRVNDYANIFQSSTKRQLETLLTQLEQTDSTQIVVLTIPSLDGDSLEEFSIRVVEKWKPGQAQLDNGILLLIAKNDRKIRIEVGYGLEGKLTDLMAGRIIQQVIGPQFKQGNFDQGIVDGLSALVQVVRGEFVAPAGKKNKTRPGGAHPGGLAVLALLFFLNMLGRIHRFLGGVAGAILAPIAAMLLLNVGLVGAVMSIPVGFAGGILLSLMGGPLTYGHSVTRRQGGYLGGGGGFGGFGGGGFGGFSGGGGGFGGGGASGGW